MIIIFLNVVTFLAATINTVTGFGFGILSVALYVLVLPTSISVPVSGMISFFLSGSLMKAGFQYISWKDLIIPLPFALAASAIGVHYGIALPEQGLKRILGAVLFFLAVYFIWYSKKICIRPAPWKGIVMGILGGSLQGLFGMGGPPMVLYYLSCISDKNVYIATLQVYFVVMNISIIVMRIIQGQVTTVCWRYFFVLLFPMAAGVLIGKKLFKKCNDEYLRKFSYGCIAMCGIYFLIKG